VDRKVSEEEERLEAEIVGLYEDIHRANEEIQERRNAIARLRWQDFPLGCVVSQGGKDSKEYVVVGLTQSSLVCRRRVASGEFGSRTYDVYYPEKLRDVE